MTFVFTSKLQAFVDRMLESPELERTGYELLLKQEYFADIFEHLERAGLFGPARVPGPKPAQEPGYVQIPYWEPLDYLEACAKVASEKGDSDLAQRVLNVIRAAGRAQLDGKPIRNYHTARKFVEMLALMPTELITFDDIDLVGEWLLDPYDRGLVAHSLSKGLLKKLIASPNQQDWLKGVRLVGACTRMREGDGDDQLLPVVDAYWLKALLSEHAVALGSRAGAELTNLLLERMRSVFGTASRSRYSSIFRPAIEDHPQNKDFRGPENIFVEAARDVLLTWIDTGHGEATEKVKELLDDSLGIVRRIGTYIVDARWNILGEFFLSKLSAEFFETEVLHEMYSLLKHHFGQFPSNAQAAVLDIIRSLQTSGEGEDARRTKYLQRRWLSAVEGQGNADADAWFAALGEGPDSVGVSKYPDLASYIETSWGDGESLYSVEELIAFAESGRLVEALNSFRQQSSWEGPSERALVSSLTLAVQQDASLFTRLLPTLGGLKRGYQYGLLEGFRSAAKGAPQGSTDPAQGVDWGAVLAYSLSIIEQESFWTEEVEHKDGFVPNRNWIPPIISDLVRAAARDDSGGYSPQLSATVRRTIEVLLVHSEALEEISNDPMTAAINSPRGKAIEALFEYALKECRREPSAKEATWTAIEPLFDAELERTKEGNFEFSTLAAAYLQQLQFLSQSWLERSVLKIFRTDSPANFDAAVAGFAYAQPSRYMYQLLDRAGIIEAGLAQYHGKTNYRERIIESVALAYLWGDESLNGSKLTRAIGETDAEFLRTTAEFFWRLSGQDLTQEQREKVLAFWRATSSSALREGVGDKHLFSALARLICYMDTLADSDTSMVADLAQHSHLAYDEDRVIEELARLVKSSPKNVYRVLSAMLAAHVPVFDFEGRLQSLVRAVHAAGLKDEALILINQLRKLEGFRELLAEIGPV